MSEDIANTMIFVDYWNLQLSLNRIQKKPFNISFSKLASAILTRIPFKTRYIGMNIYASYNPTTYEGQQLKQRLETINKNYRAVRLTLVETQPSKNKINCNSCHSEITICPSCKEEIKLREEKGIDMQIGMDMVGLAWNGKYDTAVIISSDRDFIPAINLLRKNKIYVIHANPKDRYGLLSEACNYEIRLPDVCEEFRYVTHRKQISSVYGKENEGTIFRTPSSWMPPTPRLD